ncbi:hypothetical protein BU16DRAFT_565332 [Lophium mytilinum]|uniref:PARP catalytic domain-containing protein n=1 Tax=Lophium mytilinum TaxID=390894 RepID=A0A6A6QGU0_9PEZI|nr:hypothetical protein BU16DRAFT_565332 [Lophium mytilinum]
MVLFGKRKSDGWKIQVTATANHEHPSSPNFPWDQLQAHTDLYLKKKGKITPAERDFKLAALVDDYDDRDVAIAACAFAMSSQALRILLNVETNVAPVTYYGLYAYLQSLIAVNYRGQLGTVSDLEARWARGLVPYASPGPQAAVRFLDGVTNILRDKSLQNLQSLPNFAFLTRRALVDFASSLEGFKLKNQWVAAHAAVVWLSKLLNNPSPPSHSLGPEQLLDSQLPSWRIWALWKPDLDRLRLLESLPSHTRGVLHDMLALEGPDFLGKRYSSIREALVTCITEISQTHVRYGTLSIEVKTQTADEFKTILNRLSTCLETVCKAGMDSIELFVHLCAGKHVTQEALQILIGTSKLADPSVIPSVLKVVTDRDQLGQNQWESMNRLLPALEDPSSELLRGVLCPYITKGVQNCIHEMQVRVHKSLTDGSPSTRIILELQKFGKTAQDASTLHPLLDVSLRTLLSAWPSEAHTLTLLEIRAESRGDNLKKATPVPLTQVIDMFFMDRLIKPGRLDAPSAKLLDSLTLIWKATASDSPRRGLSLLVAGNAAIETDLRTRCLDQVMILTNTTAENLGACMWKHQKDPDSACIILVDLLAKIDDADIVECWRWILFQYIEQRDDAILPFALEKLRAKEWLQLLWNLSTIFGDIIPTSTSISPAPLQPALHTWAHCLADYVPVITHLEKMLISPDQKGAPPLRCILFGRETDRADLTRILDSVKKYMHQGSLYETPMYWTIQRLVENGDNVTDVSKAICALSTSSPEGVEVYQGLIDLHQETPAAIVEVFLTGWIQDLEKDDKEAVKALATVLHLEVSEVQSNEKVEAAAAYIEAQVAEVLKEATRLDSLRGGLKARDPKGTAALLASLGIEDSSPLDDEFDDLPSELMDLIERYGDQEVEMSFPISHLSDLEKAALGAGEAQSVIVRLVIDTIGDLPPGFCIHLGDDKVAESLDEHYPWVVFREAAEPERPSCHGRSTRMTWQLSRIVARHLKNSGYTSLQNIHKYITQQINDLAYSCIVCGAPHGARQARLRRPIACQKAVCTTVWNRAGADVRLTDIRTDRNVVDMLLFGVFAAAQSGRADLLPGCAVSSLPTVTTILNALPAMTSTNWKAIDVSTALRASHSSAEQLITWVLSSYRGYLASTSGILKIPNMPGVHQFVLANAAPELEAAFATRVGRNGTTKVLFHGTSLDRLPAILSQGLKICSGTTLQRTGAAHGNGIYMAEDPGTSFSYSPLQASWRNSSFHNHRVLLGCELAGNGNSVSPGIHVIKDPGTVMVRYVFLFSSTAAAPLAIHVTPAMISAFAALRSGAV